MYRLGQTHENPENIVQNASIFDSTYGHCFSQEGILYKACFSMLNKATAKLWSRVTLEPSNNFP